MQLLPRDVKFYDLFLLQARMVVEAAGLLREGTSEANGKMSAAAERIYKMERKADEVEHQTYKRLHKTFITPVDPEDIHAIASGLDQILDAIESTAYRIVAYRLTPIPERMQKLAGVLHQCTEELYKIFEALNEKGLEKAEYISAQCIRVNELETEGEKLARGGVAEVFANETDAIALIKEKEIYEYFESACDRCEDLAGILENVVAKNS